MPGTGKPGLPPRESRSTLPLARRRLRRGRGRTGRPRAPILFGIPPPETCASPVALDARAHPLRARGGVAARPRRRPSR